LGGAKLSEPGVIIIPNWVPELDIAPELDFPTCDKVFLIFAVTGNFERKLV
jgi:hypothetical protein